MCDNLNKVFREIKKYYKDIICKINCMQNIKYVIDKCKQRKI